MKTITDKEVALHVSAWIEALMFLQLFVLPQVALHVSAWIEAELNYFIGQDLSSRTPCECVD